jgi:hypothetical protein
MIPCRGAASPAFPKEPFSILYCLLGFTNYHSIANSNITLKMRLSLRKKSTLVTTKGLANVATEQQIDYQIWNVKV